MFLYKALVNTVFSFVLNTQVWNCWIINKYVSLKETAKVFSKTVVPSYIQTMNIWEIWLICSLPTLVLSVNFITAISVGVWWAVIISPWIFLSGLNIREIWPHNTSWEVFPLPVFSNWGKFFIWFHIKVFSSLTDTSLYILLLVFIICNFYLPWICLFHLSCWTYWYKIVHNIPFCPLIAAEFIMMSSLSFLILAICALSLFSISPVWYLSILLLFLKSQFWDIVHFSVFVYFLFLWFQLLSY